MNKKEILVTGGAGFIGSEFIRQAVKKNYQITVIDKLTYAGDLKRLDGIIDNINFYKADISNLKEIKKIFSKKLPETIIHFAAETHVDRSLLNPSIFIKTNTVGTGNLIALSIKNNVKKFVHISTDEVYGPSIKGNFDENSLLNPTNPYSQSKALAEILVSNAITSKKINGFIIRPCNCYGPWQHPEKFIPVAILNSLQNKKILIYGNGLQKREWLHVSDCASGILHIIENAKLNEIYNLGSGFESTNIKTAAKILKTMNKPISGIDFIKDREGHDSRYFLNSEKIQSIGWKPKINFTLGIKKTIEWNSKNLSWIIAHQKKSKKFFVKNYSKKNKIAAKKLN